MICTACNAGVPEGNAFCHLCGAKLPEVMSSQQSAASPLPRGAAFSRQAGAVPRQVVIHQPPRYAGSTILRWILFIAGSLIGGFGLAAGIAVAGEEETGLATAQGIAVFYIFGALLTWCLFGAVLLYLSQLQSALSRIEERLR